MNSLVSLLVYLAGSQADVAPEGTEFDLDGESYCVTGWNMEDGILMASLSEGDESIQRKFKITAEEIN